MLCILFSSTILSSNIARRNSITIFGEASRCTRLRVTTESNFHFFLLASHEGENLIQIFTKLLSRDRPDEIQLGAAKWLVFHPVNSQQKTLQSQKTADISRRHYYITIFNTDDAALPGLGSDRSCKSGGHYHMHTVGTIGPLQLLQPFTWHKTAVLERKSSTGTRQTKDIHNFKW